MVVFAKEEITIRNHAKAKSAQLIVPGNNGEIGLIVVRHAGMEPGLKHEEKMLKKLMVVFAKDQIKKRNHAKTKSVQLIVPGHNGEIGLIVVRHAGMEPELKHEEKMLEKLMVVFAKEQIKKRNHAKTKSAQLIVPGHNGEIGLIVVRHAGMEPELKNEEK